jgi:hypothetical protein
VDARSSAALPALAVSAFPSSADSSLVLTSKVPAATPSTSATSSSSEASLLTSAGNSVRQIFETVYPPPPPLLTLPASAFDDGASAAPATPPGPGAPVTFTVETTYLITWSFAVWLQAPPRLPHHPSERDFCCRTRCGLQNLRSL